MGLISLLQSSPLAFVVVALALVISLTVHEFAHAYTADRLGDPTPRHFGRVTLNPAAHLDPWGTLMMLFLGFGFARPVPINPRNLGRWGTLAVAAAGPLSNLLIALICALLVRVLPANDLLDIILVTIASTNVVLAVFNLLPIPLLDGSRILGSLIPSLGRSLDEFERTPYSFIIVMAFIYIANRPISQLIGLVQGWIYQFAGLN